MRENGVWEESTKVQQSWATENRSVAKTRRWLDFEDIEALRNLDFNLRVRANSLEKNIFQNMGFLGTSHQNALQKLVVEDWTVLFSFSSSCSLC